MKSLSSGIYIIKNNINNKVYVGQSNNVFFRWNEHYRSSLLNKKVDNNILHKAIRKYGIENFTFQVLELCDNSLLDEKEKYYIKLYNADAHENYNIYPGGKGGNLKGELNPNSKLTDKDVYNIREDYKNLKTQRKTYQKYKNIVSINTFKDVWNGKTWKHIHMDVYTEDNKKKQRNNYDKIKSHESSRKLTDEQILFIRKKRKEGFKPNEVYDKYFNNINRNTFNDAWYYNTFKHLTV